MAWFLKMPAAPLPDLDALDAAALKALIVSQHEQLSSHAAEIERLRLLIARLQRLQFGRKSEKLERQIEQLQLDDLEKNAAEKKQRAENTLPLPAAAIFARVTEKPARRPLPDHLPRQTETHQPEQESCPGCGGSCVSWARMSPKCSSMYRHASK
jgi:transposase